MIGALLIVAGAGFLVLFNRALAVYVLDGSALVGAARHCRRGSGGRCSRGASAPARQLVAIACALIVVNWIFVLKVLPSFEAYKPAPGLAAISEAARGAR